MNSLRQSIFAETQGWLTPAEGAALERHALECNGPFVEIGSYCGKSTLWLGSAAEAKGTHLFAIDNRKGCPPQWTYVGDGLIETLRKADLFGVVIPIVGDASAVGLRCYIEHDFCFIDGDHSYQAVMQDFHWWGESCDGTLAFHDSGETGPAQVLSEIGAYGWRPIETVDSLTFLRRIP